MCVLWYGNKRNDTVAAPKDPNSLATEPKDSILKELVPDGGSQADL